MSILLRNMHEDKDDASTADAAPIITRTVSFLLVDTIVGRIIWAATSIATSRYLLTGHLNYPLHLLAVHLAAIQVMRLCCARKLRDFTHMPTTQMVPDMPTAMLMALSAPLLILGYKSLVYLGSFSSLVMIMSLDWRPWSLLQRTISLDVRAGDLLRYGFFLAGLLAILLYDYRLTSAPRDMSLAFLGCTGLAQVVASWKRITREYRPQHQQQGCDTGIWQTFWPLWPLVVVTMLMIQLEPLRCETHISLFPTAVAFGVNILATVVVALPTSLDSDFETVLCSDLSSSAMDTSLLDLAVRMGLTGLVSAISLCLSSRPTILSPWQCGGYLLALFAFLKKCDVVRMFQWPDIADTVLHEATIVRLPPKIMGLMALGGASWMYTWYSAFQASLSPQDFSSLSLSPPPMPYADLDVVIARYAESPTSLAHDINSLFATPKIRSLEPRVIIYNKNTDEEEFQSKVLAMLPNRTNVEFKTLENLGREGDTYLHHIISNWENLSKQTLFMQAEPHDLRTTKQYIQEFLIPETGFLSLSYEGNVCESCEYCHDTSWSDDSALVSKMYASANAGKSCQDLVLTYRGQFIVSGARIRGNEKTLYEGLLQQLRDPESYIHSEPYTKSVWHRHQEDSLQTPAYGFTLERMWGVLMQCSNLRVGYGSPSQLAVSARPRWLGGGFPVDSAQCLDRPVEGIQ